jgi:hypothetical protein
VVDVVQQMWRTKRSLWKTTMALSETNTSTPARPKESNSERTPPVVMPTIYSRSAFMGAACATERHDVTGGREEKRTTTS